MRFSCVQGELSRALGMVSRAVPSRSTGHPILANVLIVAEQGRLLLTSFDLSIGIRCSVAASVESVGSITLPARTLNDIVSKLPDEALLFNLDGGGVTISTARGSYSLSGLPADEYPELPTAAGDCVELPAKSLIAGIKAVAGVCSSDETKQVLTGVHLTATAEQIEFAATDGHRLARCQTEGGGDFEVTIPARALRDLERLLASSREDDTIALYLDRGQVLFQWGEQCLTSRTLDGQYPNYNQLIPQRFSQKLVADRKLLADALDRVGVLADQKNVIKMSIDGKSQSLAVGTEAADVGSGVEQLEAQVTGDGLEVAFNCKYLQEGLRLQCSEVQISLNSPTSPVVIEPLGGDRVMHLVMPVQIRS